MQLTVLGRSGPFPRANEACSGYLVRSGKTNLLLDCGAGVFSRLCTVCDFSGLDAIVLSHLHYDHCADMAVLRYALEQCPRAPLPVYCPLEPAEAFAIFHYPVFDIHPLADLQRAEIGALSLSFHAMAHPVPTFGVNVADSATGLFYTGDTGWFDGLAPLISGSTALLCDCCFTEGDSGKPNVHLRVKQAGQLARETGVKTLYCTHLWGGAADDAAYKKELDFSPAVVVQELRSYDILP